MREKCNGNCFCDFKNILIDCIDKLYFLKNIVLCLHLYCLINIYLFYNYRSTT